MGEPIQRSLLQSVTMLPLESSMWLLEEKLGDLTEDFVRPFLEQRSSDLVQGQVHNADTEIITKGLPVKGCSVAGCEEAPAKQCRERECRRLVCETHAAEVKEGSC